MERMTIERVNGIKTGYWSPKTKEELVQRLAQYENIGLTPEELGCINRGDCDCDHDQICVCLGLVRRRFADLEAQLVAGPWIPTSERLPDYTGRFLVVLEVIEDGFAKGIKTIDIARRCSDSTWEMPGVSIKCKVTHWMPLPEPPEEVRA